MSIVTTVHLDEDVFRELSEASVSQGVPLDELLDKAIRHGLLALKTRPSHPRYEVRPEALGTFPNVSLDKIALLIEETEGSNWR